MTSRDSPAELVARFLRANNFTDTLAAFLKEAGLPQDAGSLAAGALTIEQILREKQLYDLSVNFEKTGTCSINQEWTLPAPSVATNLTLPSNANILHVSIETFDISGRLQQLLVVSTADRRLTLLDPTNSFGVVRSVTHFQDSPILTFLVLFSRYILCGSMSGRILLYDFELDQVISQRKDHAKYVVQLAAYDSSERQKWIASAAWDRKVFIYSLAYGSDAAPAMQKPIAQIDIATNPEAILFTHHPDSSHLYLLLTRRDSTFISFYDLSELPGQSANPGVIPLAGQQNLAPHSNAWIAFTPAAMAPCPTDQTRVAIATSSVPHMKVLVVRLLFPKEKSHPDEMVNYVQREAAQPQGPNSNSADLPAPSAANNIRPELMQADREEAAVLLHCNAFASQTPYSTPAIVWRPDGSGLWVNSDDGVIRGLEASTGKVMARFEGHQAGSKIRCLWAGRTNAFAHEGSKCEWVLSGGFDQHLVGWS